MKKVTAVLPARNCRQDLSRCLSALGRGNYVPDIIVVDDGSDDGTEQMIRKQWPGVTYLSLPAHTGYAHAANAGLRLVRTQYAFLIRPDLRAGKKCIERLLQAMDEDVFCAVPEFCTEDDTRSQGSCGVFGLPQNSRRISGLRQSSRRASGKKKAGAVPDRTFFSETARRGGKTRSAAEMIAVPDGCAMYRMTALEEIGWFDERHFDGLVAFDLSLRAALSGWKTVKMPGAYVRQPAEQTSAGDSAHSTGGSGRFRRQLAAGNGMYVFYKNIPGPMRILGLPLFAAADAAQIASFVRHGEFGAYRTASERGRALCSMEKERRAALEDGTGIWPENLSDASFLGMDEAAEKIYPLFLAEKQSVDIYRLGSYLHIQGMMAAEFLQLIRLLV